MVLMGSDEGGQRRGGLAVLANAEPPQHCRRLAYPRDIWTTQLGQQVAVNVLRLQRFLKIFWGRFDVGPFFFGGDVCSTLQHLKCEAELENKIYL